MAYINKPGASNNVYDFYRQRQQNPTQSGPNPYGVSSDLLNWFMGADEASRRAMIQDMKPMDGYRLLQQFGGGNPNQLLNFYSMGSTEGSSYKPGMFGTQYSNASQWAQPGQSSQRQANPYADMRVLYRDNMGMIHDPGDNPYAPPSGPEAPIDNPYQGGKPWRGGYGHRGQGNGLMQPQPTYARPTTPTRGTAPNGTTSVGGNPYSAGQQQQIDQFRQNRNQPTAPTQPQAPNPTTHPGQFGRDPNDPYKPHQNKSFY